MKKENKELEKGKRLKRAVKATSGFILAAELTLVTSPVYASNQITTGLNNLKDLMISAVKIIGAIIVVKNIMEASSAYQQQDSSGMNSALKGIVGGLMMAFVGTVLTILGV